MPGTEKDLASNQPELAETERLLLEIAESETFCSAPSMRNLLTYLWKQRDSSISEYAIGLEALGRQPGFDSKSDASVRVAVARLRGKLKEFYQKADGDFPLRLTIPLGSHELKWTYVPPPSMPAAVPVVMPAGAPAAAPVASVERNWIVPAAGLVIVLLGLALVILYAEIRTLKAGSSSTVTSSASPLPRFWRSFVRGGKPVVVIVPNPLYLVWSTGIIVRDRNISKFADWPKSPFFADMAARWGNPSPTQSYVGAVEMLTATRLVQYLERSGQQVELLDSARFSADSFAAQDTISIGMPRTAVYLDRLLERTNFYLERVDPDIVRSRNPLPGEPAEFTQQSLSREHAVHPGIIICLPARPEQTRSLLLIGNYPNGITPMLISTEGLQQLEDQWVKAGSPEAWEMVVQAEIFRDTALKVWPVAFRPMPKNFWK